MPDDRELARLLGLSAPAIPSVSRPAVRASWIRESTRGALQRVPPWAPDRQVAPWVAELATECMRSCGMPPTSTWAFVFADGPIDAKRPETPVAVVTADPARQIIAHIPTKTYEGLAGHSFQFFGRLLDPHVEGEGDAPRWLLDFDGTPQINLQIWDMYAYKPGGPFMVQRTWRPGEGEHATIECLRDEWGDADHAATAVALRWLRDFKAIVKRAGGPVAMSDAEAFEQAVRFGLEWLRDHPGKLPGDFGDPELAAMLVISVPSVRTHMTRKHFGIKRVRREIRRRLGES